MVTRTYFVECYWPGVSEPEAVAAVERISRAPGRSRSVSLVESILVPADEIVLCIFEGPSARAVGVSAQRCGLPADRIVDCVQLPPGADGGSRT
jgi:uncharacterized protein DUF4242